MRILCIIPVRGGSKGILRKNAAEITEGISLLEWTIRQACEAYPIEDIVVSTEDEELEIIAKKCGVLVVERPIQLAQDETTTSAVVDHLLAELEHSAQQYKALSILQVTSPLRQVKDILRSIEIINCNNYDSVVSAFQTTACHPAKLYFLDQTSALPLAIPVAPELQRSRRQNLPKVYRRNGAIFIVTREFYSKTGQLWGGKTGLVEMPESRSIDIDTIVDLQLARRSIKQLKFEPQL